MTPHPRKCGRAQTLAKLRDIAESWRVDTDPLKQWVAQRAAALLAADAIAAADGKPDHARRYRAIVRAIGLFGVLGLRQQRVRAVVEGIESPAARLEAFRQAFPALHRLTDKQINRRIRAALT